MADFSGAKLTNVDFTDADLTYANFEKAEFVNVTLDGADTTNANFNDVKR